MSFNNIKSLFLWTLFFFKIIIYNVILGFAKKSLFSDSPLLLGTTLWSYCGCTLGLLYMLRQQLSSSLMEIFKPGCLRNGESGETSLSWIYPQSIESQCNTKDQRYRVWSLGPWKSFQVILSIKNTWPLILGILVTVRDGGAEAEQQEQTGGETGTLAQSLTHSVTHRVTHSLFFYRECRSRSSTLPIHVSDTACN